MPLILALFLFSTYSFSQVVVNEIKATDGSHYITTTINYPVSGTYYFEETKEPIVQLNPDGSGVFQQHDLSKSTISWGFECSKIGIPKFKRGFNYAVYTLWYKTDTGDTENWVNAHFSIHFQKKQMFILGERVKEYVDEDEE